MRLGLKLGSGFGAVIVVIGVTGAIGWAVLWGIASSVTELGTRTLPTASAGTRVERAALDLAAAEKQYMLLRTQESHAKVIGMISGLDSEIGKLGAACERAGDTDLQFLVMGVKGSASEYGELFGRAAAVVPRNREQEARMNEKGAVVDQVAASLMATKKQEYRKAVDALALLNSINAMTLDIRFNEKSYMLVQASVHVSGIQRNISQIAQACDQLLALQLNETETKQTRNIQSTIQEYKTAFASWVEENKRDANGAGLADLAKTMSRSGDQVAQTVDDFIMVKQPSVEKAFQGLVLAAEIKDLAAGVRLCEKRFMIAREAADWTTLQEQVKKLGSLYTAIRKVATSAEDKQRIDGAAAATEAYLAAASAWVKDSGEIHDVLLPGMAAKGDLVLNAARKVQGSAAAKAESASRRTSDTAGTSSKVILVVLAAGTLLGALVAFFLTRSISGPLNRLIASMTHGAERVTSASGIVAGSSQDMAKGVSDQASSLEETSAALEEMASMTRQNADNANLANAVAKEANALATAGVASMGRMTEAIDRIKASATETAKIIKTIDEIAFQTNLLALNAAVEAARAGEAGKGFAVVAEEVRNLARRSAEAAKNTADLIEGAQKNAEAGVAVTGEVGKNLMAIRENAGKVAALIAEIAAASKEQAQGIDQVNTAVSEMDKVVQRNAANAQESATASDELSDQARALNTMVDGLAAIVSGGGQPRQLVEAKGEGAARKQIADGAVSAKKELPARVVKDKTVGRPAERKAPAKGRTASAKPEEVIPLDDHELKGF